jgi:hypothetical protein
MDGKVTDLFAWQVKGLKKNVRCLHFVHVLECRVGNTRDNAGNASFSLGKPYRDALRNEQ